MSECFHSLSMLSYRHNDKQINARSNSKQSALLGATLNTSEGQGTSLPDVCQMVTLSCCLHPLLPRPHFSWRWEQLVQSCPHWKQQSLTFMLLRDWNLHSRQSWGHYEVSAWPALMCGDKEQRWYVTNALWQFYTPLTTQTDSFPTEQANTDIKIKIFLICLNHSAPH